MITSPRFETSSPVETVALGKQLAAGLRTGDVLALYGDLGAGKTCFVKGIALGCDVTQEVTSPTFTLIHEYREGRLPLYHVDLYRLDSVEQALAIGIEEHLPSDGVTIIEWPEKIEALLPAHTKRIRIESISETHRRFQII